MKKLVGCLLMPHPPLIIPEVGKTETRRVEKTIAAAQRASRDIVNENPHTIVVITPHGPLFSNSLSISIQPFLQGSMSNFGAPEVVLGFRTDSLLIKQIIEQADQRGLKVVKLTEELAKTYHISLQLDHGSMVPLYFLHKAGFKGQVIHISAGILPNEKMYAFGQAVKAAVDMFDKRIAVIASGDLSHRLTPNAPAGYSERGKEFDALIQQYLKSMNRAALLNIDESLLAEAGECGFKPIVALLGVVDGLTVTPEILSYEGPFGVGYMVAKFEID